MPGGLPGGIWIVSLENKQWAVFIKKDESTSDQQVKQDDLATFA